MFWVRIRRNRTRTGIAVEDKASTSRLVYPTLSSTLTRVTLVESTIRVNVDYSSRRTRAIGTCTSDQIRRTIESLQTLKMRKIIRRSMNNLDKLTTTWKTWVTIRRTPARLSLAAPTTRTSKIKSATTLVHLTIWKTRRSGTRNTGISAKTRMTWRRIWLWRKKL